jgi:hypothetical protein
MAPLLAYCGGEGEAILTGQIGRRKGVVPEHSVREPEQSRQDFARMEANGPVTATLGLVFGEGQSHPRDLELPHAPIVPSLASKVSVE